MGSTISAIGSGIGSLFGGGAPAAYDLYNEAWMSPSTFGGAAGNAAGNAGGWLGAAGNIAKSLAMPAASIGASYLQGKQAEKRSDAYNQALLNASKQNQQTWQQNAYPTQGAVNSMNTQLRSGLGQARLQSTQNMANQLAARGIGAGSGYMAQRQGDIESAYLKGLGSGLTDIQKFANTAQFGMPGSAYYSPTQTSTTGAESATGQASSLFDTYYGYNQMQKLIQDVLGAGR